MYDRLWSEGPSLSSPSTCPLPTISLFEPGPPECRCADRPGTTDALAAATSTLSLDAQKRAEKDAHKKALKAEAAEQKHLQQIAESKITIKRVERNKVRPFTSRLPRLAMVFFLVKLDTNYFTEEVRNHRNRPGSVRVRE
jgi:hypothetical protein